MMRTYHVDIDKAQRVGQSAVELCSQLRLGEGAAELLRWAADLHEIGLAISHAGYQKNSSYLVQHADMQGFSRHEQLQLSFLLLNHRRKLHHMDPVYGFSPDWRMVMCLRLACLVHRSRREQSNLKWSLSIGDRADFTLRIDAEWLRQHPLLVGDLQSEVKYWKRLDYHLHLETPDGAVQAVGGGVAS